MNLEGRALPETEIDRIRTDVFNGLYSDRDVIRVFETIQIQRQVLRQMFNLFTSEPMRLVSTADPIRNSTLTHLKELVSLEDGR